MGSEALNSEEGFDDRRFAPPWMLRVMHPVNIVIPGTIKTKMLVLLNERRTPPTSGAQLDRLLLRAVRRGRQEPQLAEFFFPGTSPSLMYAAFDVVGLVLEREGRRVHVRDLDHIDGFRKLSWAARSSPIDLKKVKFCEHGWRRFHQRYRGGLPTRVQALLLLAQSSETRAIDPAAKVVRLINNKFHHARYFRVGDWRFVIEDQPDGSFLIRTFELINRGMIFRPEDR